MKKQLFIVLCVFMAISLHGSQVLPPENKMTEQTSELDQWQNAYYYFIYQPEQEKKSAYNQFLRAFGWLLRTSTSVATGGFLGYKSYHYLKNLNKGGNPHKAVDWSRYFIMDWCVVPLSKNLLPKIPFAKESLAKVDPFLSKFTSKNLKSDASQNAEAGQGDQEIDPFLVTLSSAAGLTTTWASYKLLGAIFSGLNRDRIIDLRCIYNAINTDKQSRDFISIMPPRLKANLRMPMTPGRKLNNDTALILLRRIRNQIDDFFSGTRAYKLN